MRQFKREQLTTSLAREVEPLLHKHKEEVSLFPEDVNVAWDSYFALEEAGNLRAYTYRDSGRLVGYAAYILMHHLHYRDLFFAYQDVLYLHPLWRSGRNGIWLIKKSEEALRDDGVKMVLQTTKERRDLTSLFTSLGYEICDKVYMKRF